MEDLNDKKFKSEIEAIMQRVEAIMKRIEEASPNPSPRHRAAERSNPLEGDSNV
jgi:hypothetical protein